MKKQAILLKKALYSLKQSPRVWQDALKSTLLNLGYLPLVSNSSIYYNKINNIFIITYIDDCLIIGPNLGEINSLKLKLHKIYALEDKEEAKLFLGVQII